MPDPIILELYPLINILFTTCAEMSLPLEYTQSHIDPRIFSKIEKEKQKHIINREHQTSSDRINNGGLISVQGLTFYL